ncbi:MAG TPA: energy-coupling factor ABC transporter permease [Peptostreptococcaceae bacterium]|nr:energy-coupling factor ABC transporter permease [Peptostreptococcaceae bacterium]
MKDLKLGLIAGLLLVFLNPINSSAMHIMEGFLPFKWSLIWSIIFIPFFIKGLQNLRLIFKNDPNKKLLIALVGAFVFVLSALKIPSITGSSSHPTGVGLGAILFGPGVMSVVGTIVLLFQALLLAHGGITTLGANAFSMAVVGPIISYLIFKFMKKRNIKTAKCVFLSATVGDLATYTITSIQLALAFPDPSGGIIASLLKFLSIFLLTQIPIAIAEGILTTVVYNLLLQNKVEGVIGDEYKYETEINEQ